MTTAMGVQPDSNGNGLDPLSHRKIIAAQYANVGIMDGLEVSGRSDLTYAVAAGVAVCSRSVADGKTVAYWGGGQSPATSAGDPSNPRIDVVYLVAHDIAQGDADNHVTLGVLQGQAAASPVAPSLSSVPGALRLRSFRMPAGATATTSAVALDSYDYAIPYGSSLGLLGEDVQTMDGTGDGTPWHFYIEQPISFYLPTDRLVRFEFSGCISANGGESARGGWFVDFRVDGVDLAGSGNEFSLDNVWQTKRHEFTTALAAGQHTAQIRSANSWGSAPVFHYSARSVEGQSLTQYIGRVFRVWDQGVAQ
ncbi:hypothetical protein GCM10009785_34750 [Brooklawnia cerclae]|uniref:Uncharacterized protein n=1 Tax=Brooklawnia cerclae TaxID=349934 RepID=A0ABX0SJF9_9ACTN|nr:hypothetical protein [Brooklawnia cerclae]NIH58464.1 hypothetical protein [Brooklawnia cerclae]